jgi:hypothetical protein
MRRAEENRDEMSRSDYMATSTFNRAGFYFPLAAKIADTAAATASMVGGYSILPFFIPCTMKRAFLPGLNCCSGQLFLTSNNAFMERDIRSDHLSYVINHDGGLKRWPLC